MAQLDFYTALAKWLKKAKLRDGSHSVGFTAEGTFYYRGFPLGFMEEKQVVLKWPATLLENSGHLAFVPYEKCETVSILDPQFFQKLRKAFRKAMTAINAVSIDMKRPVLPRNSKTPPTKQ